MALFGKLIFLALISTVFSISLGPIQDKGSVRNEKKTSAEFNRISRIPFQPCGGHGETLRVDIEDCTSSTCFFDHSLEYEMAIEFVAKYSTNAIRYVVRFNTSAEDEYFLRNEDAPGDVIGGSAYRASAPIDLTGYENKAGTMTIELYDDIMDRGLAACGSFTGIIN